MKNLKSKLILLSIITIMFSSCATMISGTQESVKFNSNPSGAKVIINGRDLWITNSDISYNKGISGKMNPIVRYEKEGYKPVEFYLERKTTPSYWLNIFNLFIFAVYDFELGSIYQSKYKEYTKELEKE